MTLFILKTSRLVAYRFVYSFFLFCHLVYGKFISSSWVYGVAVKLGTPENVMMILDKVEGNVLLCAAAAIVNKLNIRCLFDRIDSGNRAVSITYRDSVISRIYISFDCNYISIYRQLLWELFERF